MKLGLLVFFWRLPSNLCLTILGVLDFFPGDSLDFKIYSGNHLLPTELEAEIFKKKLGKHHLDL